MNGERVENVNVHVSYARRQYHNDRGDIPISSRGKCIVTYICVILYAWRLCIDMCLWAVRLPYGKPAPFLADEARSAPGL